jgi:lysophospholipase L1-like esterase
MGLALSSLLAQTPAAVSQPKPAAAAQEPPVTPEQLTKASDRPLNPALPTLFIVGDSTARNQADQGWGDHFAHYFDPTEVNVANRAIAGRSSRTYIKEGAWDRVLAEMKKGDYVLIQMGHNDGGQLDGPKPRGTLKGIGDESREVTLLDGSKETVHTYGWYIRKYIADTRAHGATPILLTLTIRNIWTKGADGKQHIERDMGYGEFLRQIAAAEHVELLDMAAREADDFDLLGPEHVAKFFPVDHTHTSADGAEFVARYVVSTLQESKLPINDWLDLPLPRLRIDGMHNK